MTDAQFWRPWSYLIAVVIIFGTTGVEAHGIANQHRHNHHGHAVHTLRHHLRRHHMARETPVIHGASIGVGTPDDTVAIAMRYLGSHNPTGSRGPWCGDFMNLIEHLAGHHGIASRMAPAWASYGHPSAPVRGAIAVFRSHVALVIGRAGDRLQIISGNWSRRVGIGWVSLRSAIAFRTP